MSEHLTSDEELFRKIPLAKFSFYLSGRVQVLNSTSEEILQALDESFDNGILYNEKLSHAEGLFWFWTLGAYEVVRAMCNPKTKICFSESTYNKLSQLKSLLSKARIPVAKMEYERIRNKPDQPVPSGRSAVGIDVVGRDLKAGAPDNDLSARFMIREFQNVLAAITIDDILAPHESAYFPNNT